MKKLCLLFTLMLFAVPSFAQEPGTTRTSWGALKVRYAGATPDQSVAGVGRSIAKPGAEVSEASYSIRIRPYAVNEFWIDPNNPGSGRHVVLFFRFDTNMSRAIKLRLYNGQERSDLNSWQAWYRYPSANSEEVMLFVDGKFWWAYRWIYGWWGLSQRFELCF